MHAHIEANWLHFVPRARRGARVLHGNSSAGARTRRRIARSLGGPLGARALARCDDRRMGREPASVPPPKFHTVRYSGVLASASKLRSRIAPKPPSSSTSTTEEPIVARRPTAYRPSAKLLRRTFGFVIAVALGLSSHVLLPTSRPLGFDFGMGGSMCCSAPSASLRRTASRCCRSSRRASAWRSVRAWRSVWGSG